MYYRPLELATALKHALRTSKKEARNIFGLHGQQQTSSLVSKASFTTSGGLSPANSLCQSESESAELKGITLKFDGLKMNFEQDYCDNYSDGSDIDEELKCEIFEDEEFGCRLAEMVQKEDEVQ
jgi:hypothetical protein